MKRREILGLGVGGLVLGVGRWSRAQSGAMNCENVGAGVMRCVNSLANLELAEAANTQHASEWCWAACISMVFAFYSHNVPQERIVEETFGTLANWPAQPQTIIQALNRTWADDEGDVFVVRCESSSISIPTIGQDLKDGHPLIIGALGHAMVLKSWSYLVDYTGQWRIDDIRVLDPWPYNPRERSLTWQEVANANFGVRIRVS